MIYRLRNAVLMAWFDHNARLVLGTKPTTCDPRAGFVLVSQVCHPDVLMYLLALKSLTRFLRPAEVVVLDDGSLTGADRDILAAHVERARLVHVDDVPNPTCPKGRCWERLLAVIDAAESAYVIQLDADTLTLRYPEELKAHVAAGICFTLGTGSGKEIRSMAEAGAWGKQRVGAGARHVQMVAEASFDRLPGHQSLRYVRGSAGLAGFAAGSVSRARAEWFSQQMSGMVGRARWARWGSEQVASNFLIANASSATVLPLARYKIYEPGIDLDSAVFVHFFGSNRFKRGTYVSWSRRVVRELRTAR